MTTTLDWMQERLENIAEEGALEAKKKIAAWIMEHRTEVTPGVYRDHFTSIDLLKYLEEK